MDGAGSLVGSDAAFGAIAEAWFDILADGGGAADLAAGPGCGGAPALLDHLSGVQLTDGLLGMHMPSPLQEPSHLEGAPAALGGGPFDCRLLSIGGPAAPGAAGGGLCEQRLCRAEWARLMHACQEAWGPSLFLRKAALAAGPGGVSLLGRLLREGCAGPVAGGADCCANHAAALMLLQAVGHAGHARQGLHAFLSRALPDGAALAGSPLLEGLLLAQAQAGRAPGPPAAAIAAAPPPPAQDLDSDGQDWNKTRGYSPALPTTFSAASTAVLPGAGPASLGSTGPASSPLPPPLPPQPDACAGSCEVQPLAFLCQAGVRIGGDVSEGMLVEACPDPCKADGARQCSICLEDFPAHALRHCGRAVCGKGAYCLDCLRQHAESVVTSALYAAPSVRCPSCNLRLGTETWSPLVAEQVMSKYRENARALLTYRCAACDETRSYFAAAAGGRDPFTSLDPEVRERIGAAWRRFFLAECHAEDFLQALLVEHGCGHRCGSPPPTKLSKAFGPSGSAPWIADMERRLALQLAWMHRFPKQRTPCCGERFCFRCKVSSWHLSVSCQERLSAEKARQAQLCPGCGVPTQRSEGCRKITCVCGRVWEWEGDDSSEGTFSDDGSEEDEVAQAQTAINLVVMNSRATEENVHLAVQALVNARADVNQSSGLAAEAQVPLMLAVQCRHAAAVQALCDNGARVSPEVLEEVKVISHETGRRRIEGILRPQIQGDPNMKLPLWVWVQTGSVPAVEALLRNAAHEEAVGADVLIALSRSLGDEESRQRMTNLVSEHVGEARFQELHVSAASRRLLQELRQAHDEERDVEVDVVRRTLASGADANAREEAEDESGSESYGLTGLSLVAMNCRASRESVAATIEALLEACADANAESDEASTPLLAALQHRNVPAIEALCQGASRFTADLLDEVKLLSEPTRRHRVEDLLRPVIRSNANRRLPLWLWVQEGSYEAVDALLRQPSQDEQVDGDVFVALQRSRGDEQQRLQIQERLRLHVGAQEFERLQGVAATRRLLQELREAYDDQREVSLELVRETLQLGADGSAREEEPTDFEDDVGAYSFTALQLLVMNTKCSHEVMAEAVNSLVDAKADVNLDVSDDSPLLSALQHRCVAGVQALAQHDAKVTSEVLEELKSVSGTKARHQIEDVLQPLIDKDKSLRCPLWIWVQYGGVTAVEALLRNSSHDEEVDADVVVALQRCRGGEAVQQQITEHIKEHVGEEELPRLEGLAATRRLLLELREAHTEERDPDLEVVYDALARGANPNAREEEALEPEEEEEEDEEGLDDEEDEEEDEEEDDGAEEDTDSGEAHWPTVHQDALDDGEEEPEEELDDAA